MTERIFTRQDQAQHHGQVGNFGLALDTMGEWMRGHAEPAGA